MGKHGTGYKRVERDFYPTPLRATKALLEHVDVCGKTVWEFCCGERHMAEPLRVAGAEVFCSDIESKYADAIFDYLSNGTPPISKYDGSITNPAYGYRCKLINPFIEAGLRRMGNGFLILLLPVDCDSAQCRAHLFGSCSRFVGKIVLTERLVWFQDPFGKKAAPKENHAWYVWGNIALRESQAPVLRYAPAEHQAVSGSRHRRKTKRRP
jgi:hypothetical protein